MPSDKIAEDLKEMWVLAQSEVQPWMSVHIRRLIERCSAAEEENKVIKGGIYYHDIHCNVSRDTQQGSPGCSCWINKKLLAAEARIKELEAQVECLIKPVRNSEEVDWLTEQRWVTRSAEEAYNIADAMIRFKQKSGQ